MDGPPTADPAPLVRGATSASHEDERHRVLVTLVRVQFAASGVAVTLAAFLFGNRGLVSIFAACAVALAVLGGIAFAPMGYRARARAYTAAFVGLTVGLALLGGPQSATFLAMCGALILPLILLPLREATGYVVFCIASVCLVAWLAVRGVIVIEMQPTLHMAASPVPWIGGLITILSISVPFAVLAQRLLAMHRVEQERSDRLVERLQRENAERRAALEALQHAQQRLTHSQKLELLGQLAGGLAHDMNNALTVIQGEASFLPESATESREIIVEHANHAAQLTRQLLTLGRRDVLQPKDIDFVDEVRRAVNSVRKLLPSEIAVTETYGVDAATVHADPSQVAQIVLNLVVNARDAMVGGGALTIRVETPADAPGLVGLVIADTGHGIAPDVLDVVFEPFFSTKPEGVGTGLGLANVKEIVESLGGTLQVESEVGVGTTLRVGLPTVEARASAGEETAAADGPDRAGARILLVDDHEPVRRVTRSILERDGHDVREATNGTEAVAALSNGAPFDLVITDVVMPEGGGKDVIDCVQRTRPDAKLLVISGYAEDDRVRRGMRTGEFPFLRKPFSADELLEATRQLLRGARRGGGSDPSG